MEIFGWGANDYCQCSKTTGISVFDPTLHIDATAIEPVQVAGGSQHSLILSEHGTIHALGYGQVGQLGLGKANFNKTVIPTQVQLPNNDSAYFVGCGALTSYAISVSGRVYQWGLIHINDNNDQLNVANENTLSGKLNNSSFISFRRSYFLYFHSL
jgi:alpha-tubulin suppressor-like RCC1 family protein